MELLLFNYRPQKDRRPYSRLLSPMKKLTSKSDYRDTKNLIYLLSLEGRIKVVDFFICKELTDYWYLNEP